MTALELQHDAVVADSHNDLAGCGEPGAVARKLCRALMDVQYGRVPDTYGWIRRVV